ncbi:MAG: hypothetical protein GF418_06690 [Chitinivibrionales bacterium]|nr:hypothetical protein [Chitinivibrionales bacterium]MBD3395298.1 hypothetical protein [Chitinivibrionales bacterium]
MKHEKAIHNTGSAAAVIGMAVACALITAGCMRYLTHDRAEVLLDGVDIDQTLEIAEMVMEEGERGMSLSLWAIRDQRLTPGQAGRVSELYFEYVDSLLGKFDTWHMTWAISNMYRHGNTGVKDSLRLAYLDATVRAADTHALADKHVNGEKLWMGDAHIGGRRYSQKHVVVPGNPDYVQSAKEYRRREMDE